MRVSDLTNEEARIRFGPPIYAVAGASQKLNGGGWGGGGTVGEEILVEHVSVKQGAIDTHTRLNRSDDRELLMRLLLPRGDYDFPLTVREERCTIAIGTDSVPARVLRFDERAWVATTAAGERWVEVYGEGRPPADLALVPLVE